MANLLVNQTYVYFKTKQSHASVNTASGIHVLQVCYREKAEEMPPHLNPHQVEAQEVEDLSGIVLLEDLLERVFDEARDRLRAVLQSVAHQVIQRSPFRGIAHQRALLSFLRGRGQDAVGCGKINK